MGLLVPGRGIMAILSLNWGSTSWQLSSSTTKKGKGKEKPELRATKQGAAKKGN